MINYEEMRDGAIVGELVRSRNPIVAGARADDKAHLLSVGLRFCEPRTGQASRNLHLLYYART